MQGAVLAARGAELGTYRYARLEFCKFNDGGATNVRYQGGPMTAPKEFTRAGCVVNSEPFPEPLDIGDGDVITIVLAYDYTMSLTTGGTAGFDDCDNTSVPTTCFGLPLFVPSAGG